MDIGLVITGLWQWRPGMPSANVNIKLSSVHLTRKICYRLREEQEYSDMRD